MLAVRTAYDVPDSPARVHEPTRPRFRVAVAQLAWHADAATHDDAIAEAVHAAASERAQLVCFPELTRFPYVAINPRDPQSDPIQPEALPGGPTYALTARLAQRVNIHVHASTYERSDDGGLGYNTAFVVDPTGALIAKTRKTHLPLTAGYYEDTWFRPGDSGQPITTIADTRFGFPTCWDQWFPELARAYALAGADVLVYPSAIGSEPDHPAFDTEPIWHDVIRTQGIVNGTFMAAANRIGTEGPITFYGSSFISDPYGRVLAQASRTEPTLLVADLDLDQRHDWLALFPLLQTRRPETYSRLTDER